MLLTAELATVWRRVLMLTGLCLVLIVAGCAQIPRHSVVENSSPVEIPSTPPTQANGSIYQARFGFQPLFEDRRPRQIGDIITYATKQSSAKSIAKNE